MSMQYGIINNDIIKIEGMAIIPAPDKEAAQRFLGKIEKTIVWQG